MTVVTAIIFILAQRIRMGPPPAHPPVFTLAVETVDRAGGIMPRVKVALARVDSGGKQDVIAERAADGRGRVQFEKIPAGLYLVSGSLGGFLGAQAGPIPLNEDTVIPSPLKLMLNEYGVY